MTPRQPIISNCFSPSMHKEILTAEQVAFLPVLKLFSKNFGLVGGTAVALHLGHRRSVDFDLFTGKKFSNLAVRKIIARAARIDSVQRDEAGQYTLAANGVRFTFLQYPFPVDYSESFSGYVRLPNLLTLAAMKVHALGRRAKWKDYVDLYFIMKRHHGLDKIVRRAKRIFRNEFNEKIFRTQLAYFDDIDYSEEIIYLPGFAVTDAAVRNGLTEYSLS